MLRIQFRRGGSFYLYPPLCQANRLPLLIILLLKASQWWIPSSFVCSLLPGGKTPDEFCFTTRQSVNISSALERDQVSISVLLAAKSQANIDTLRRGLITSGYRDVRVAESGDDLEALHAAGEKFDIAVLHIENDFEEKMKQFSLLKEFWPLSECVIVSAFNDSDLATECLRRGAFDYIRMPFRKEDLASRLREAVKYKVPVSGRPRALIMEDDPVSGRLMQKYISPYCDCTLVVDGRAAIEAFEQAVLNGDIYHLLVLDIMVPEIHGKDVLKRIREIEREHGIPGSRRSRAIMTTALSDAGNIVESFKSRCDAYLVKPIDRKVLIKEIAGLGFNTDIEGLGSSG
jgi:two-component system chemotaxis response regulator CheY